MNLNWPTINEVTSIIVSKKFCYFILSGCLAYKSCTYVLSKYYYKKFFVRSFEALKNYIKLKRMDPELAGRDDLMEFIFFDAKHSDCRKHVVRRGPCESLDCSYYKLEYILNFLRSANKTIDLCIFLITCTDISDVLIEAHNRGVKVRVIVEEEMSSSTESKAQALIHAGIEVKSKIIPTFMHHKFCIVDGDVRFQRKLLTGSLNWTLQGLAGNWENVIVIKHKVVVLKYLEEFNCIWEYFDPKTQKPIAPKRKHMFITADRNK